MSEGPRIPDALAAALEQAINRLVSLDPEATRRLRRLEGRVICIELAGFGSRLYMIPGPSGLQVFGAYDAEPDCVMRGSPLGLARLGMLDRKEDPLFSGQVEVEGDAGLAQAFGDFIGGIDIDWEEQLARLTGDPVAHGLGNRARAAGRWGRRSADALADDLKEYLQEEARILPTRYEAGRFLDDVDTLRDDAERLAARVERLRRLLGDASAQPPG